MKLLFLQIAVVLTAARLTARVFRWIGQPEVVGEMAAGILLGPSLLGKISPALMNELFPANGLGPLNALSQIGLVLFLFLVGLEVRPAMIRGLVKSAVLASQASLWAPFLLGGVLAWGLYDKLGNGVPELPFALFLAAAMGITAFPVLARILAERQLMRTRVGMLAISCAAFDDVTAWCLLAVITVIARHEGSEYSLLWRLLGLAAYVLIMLFVVRPLLLRFVTGGTPTLLNRFGAVMILLMVSVWATEAMSVHALFGAFVTGVVMPRDDKLEADMRIRLEPVTVGLFLPLFFAFTGLRTSIGLLNRIDLWMLCGLIVMVAVGSKLLVSALVVHAGGMPWRESLAVGVLVNTKGLVELVILNVGLELHILSPTLFSMMVLMALATTVMTSPLLHCLEKLGADFSDEGSGGWAARTSV